MNKEKESFCIGDENSREIAEMMSFSGSASHDAKKALEEKREKERIAAQKRRSQEKRNKIAIGLVILSVVVFPFHAWTGITLGLVSGCCFMWACHRSTYG